MNANRNTLAFARLWQVIGCLMLGVVIFLTLTPHPPKVEIEILSWDKAQHTLAYAFLSWWFLQAWFTVRAATVVTGLVLVGISLEFAQGAMGVRYMEVTDMAANGIGALIGWALVRTPAGGLLARLDGVLTGH